MIRTLFRAEKRVLLVYSYIYITRTCIVYATRTHGGVSTPRVFGPERAFRKRVRSLNDIPRDRRTRPSTAGVRCTEVYACGSISEPSESPYRSASFRFAGVLRRLSYRMTIGLTVGDRHFYWARTIEQIFPEYICCRKTHTILVLSSSADHLTFNTFCRFPCKI